MAADCSAQRDRHRFAEVAETAEDAEISWTAGIATKAGTAGIVEVTTVAALVPSDLIDQSERLFVRLAQL